jgi:hypothetical protein
MRSGSESSVGSPRCRLQKAVRPARVLDHAGRVARRPFIRPAILEERLDDAHVPGGGALADGPCRAEFAHAIAGVLIQQPLVFLLGGGCGVFFKLRREGRCRAGDSDTLGLGIWRREAKQVLRLRPGRPTRRPFPQGKQAPWLRPSRPCRFACG